jgi:hypothetical protein
VGPFDKWIEWARSNDPHTFADHSVSCRAETKGPLAGESPEVIARRLNRERVAGPGGRLWSNTTIRLAWNRCSFVKDPQTGRWIARPNPQTAREHQDAPHLRIIDEGHQQAAKARQQALRDVPALFSAPAAAWRPRRHPRSVRGLSNAKAPRSNSLAGRLLPVLDLVAGTPNHRELRCWI